MLSIIKQTNYKLTKENWFWLYTYILMGILNQYIISLWPEQMCQNWICFKANKWLVHRSTLDKLFNFVLCHISLSGFIWQSLVVAIWINSLSDWYFIDLYIVQSCFTFQTNKQQNLHRKPVLTIHLHSSRHLESIWKKPVTRTDR